jgi:hypothetical protein
MWLFLHMQQGVPEAFRCSGLRIGRDVKAYLLCFGMGLDPLTGALARPLQVMPRRFPADSVR